MKGEGNQQDYGMRIYDPRIAKFLSVDPLTKHYPELTPYQFASNRTIDGIDIDGLEWIPPRKPNPDGKGFVVDGDAAIKVHTHKNNAFTVVVGTDILVTKGWLSRAYFATEAASVIEHNPARSPEGKALQNERFKEGVTDLAISYVAGKVIMGSINLFNRGLIKTDLTGGAIKENVDDAVAEVLPNLGRIQSRINVTNESWEHIVARHFSKKNASQFTVPEQELKSLLSSEKIVKTPITRTLESSDGLRYVRDVKLDKTIGLDKFNNFQPTNQMTVLTDRFGNLVTASPGVIK